MPENRNVKHRDTNFELLRIVSMILIVAHHFACSVIGVFTICAIIELLRIYFLEKPFFVFCDKHSRKVYLKLRLAEDKLMKKIHVK